MNLWAEEIGVGKMMQVSNLPDEIWGIIMEIGVGSSLLTHRDLCSLSIASRRFHRLSADDSLWDHLLSLDFPDPPPTPSPPSPSPSPLKLIYQTRYEKEKARKVAAYRREVLSLESEIAVRLKNLKELRMRMANEQEKTKATMSELANLKRVRQASVALNVWQPEVVRGRQRQLVEQCSVPIDSRIKDLEMELRVCGNQIEVSCKAYKEQKKRLNTSKERLASLKYHPLRYFQAERKNKGSHKHKKLKTSSKLEVENVVETSKRSLEEHTSSATGFDISHS